ncbi:tetratricopeptide repeat protein [Aquimarina sp. 2201CG5-10]|uniref:tetratricopeptide repeat protein n=1 Tax=Aquimarina callyspongiae TaxID=3098150 RepID=UPI002AB54F4B|nr:tetratricopeptide repeat protein [Aquimarina sp. 2201CG5-10]MDY8138017.1 tetratricopeptide repeat protein [Aquimarina sp. 2201CG5-10]
MKKVITPFLLLFSLFLCSQEQDTTLTRLEKEVKDAFIDTIKVKTLLTLGEYQLKRDFDKAEGHFVKGLDLIKDKKESYYEPYRIALFVQLGVVNRRKANYPDAIAFYIKALRFYEKQNDSSKIADVYHNMALVYRYQKEHRKAIKNYKKAITLKEKVKDTHGLGAAYNMLGVSYRQNKQLDSALICYQKAEGFFTAINSKEDLHGVYGNLAVLYGVQKRYNQSIPLKKANLKYYKKIGKRLSICVEYYNLSDDYKKMKDWQNSLKYADSSLQVALKEGFKERISVAYRRKSFVNSKMGDFENAYQNYRKFNRASDEIFNLENTKKIQALELNYQFQKEKQADSLKFVLEKKEVELRAMAEASRKKLYMILLLITLLGAGTVGWLLIRNYQQRIKMTQMEYENERKFLKQNIQSKEKDIKRLIADNTMRLTFKEELLDKIKSEVIETTPENISKSLQSLTAQLKRQITTERKLSGLQEKIDQVNKSFDQRLQKLYPELTKGEREVCSLLQLNLSIKEIMTIRNVSVDSVKSMRRRIRKKMQVPEGIELEQFIQDHA